MVVNPYQFITLFVTVGIGNLPRKTLLACRNGKPLNLPID